MRNVLKFSIFISVWLLQGCTNTWSYKIERWDSQNGPIFNFSQQSILPTEGINVQDIFIYEVSYDLATHVETYKKVWAIASDPNNLSHNKLFKLNHGTVPNGWIELTKAKLLLANKYYTISGNNYFIRDDLYNYKVYQFIPYP